MRATSRLLFSSVVAAGLILLGCPVPAGAGEPATAARKPYKIVCIGDSITVGYGASAGYPELLQDLFGPRYLVLNHGYSGATLGKRNKGKLGELQPDVITIMLGTNDADPKNWDACKVDFAKNYGDFIDSLNTLTPKPSVYLVLPIPRIGGAAESNLANEVIPLIKQVAAEKKVSVIDCYTPFRGRKELSDGLHPGDAGQKVLAETFYRALTTVEKAQVTVLDDQVEQYISADLSRRVRVTAHYTTGLVDDTAIRNCRFSSLDPEVASVSGGSRLTALTTGPARVRLEMPGFAETLTLQIVPNRTPPGLEAAYASDTDPQKVTAVFTEPVERTGAESIRSYALDNGAAVTGAALAADDRTVTLITTPLTRLIGYHLSVSGVKDKAGNAAANASMKFRYLPLVPLKNPGFESPVINRVFEYAPANAEWTFTGGRDYGSIGIDRPKEGAPEGAQLAHLNGNGSISQTVHFEFAGTYNITFVTASRASYGSRANMQVYIGDTKVADFLPPVKLTTCTFRFSVSAGDHQVMFAEQQKNRPGLGYIDHVRILPVDPDSTIGESTTQGTRKAP